MIESSNNNCVNLFFKFTQDSYKNKNFIKLLDLAWEESKIDTLKILFQGRDCRNGKGIRQSFFFAINYLSIKNPEWILINLDIIPHFGRYKDWIELINTNTQSVIINLICDQLKKDIINMNNNNNISLLAKWIPSEKKKLNKNNKITKLITRKLYDINEKEPYKKFRKEYISPLRNYLNIVENKMCKNKWNEINLSIIPSCALNKYKKVFIKHLSIYFYKWIEEVKSGKSKINTKQLYPHELVKQYINNNKYDELIETQWIDMINNYKKLGTFNKSIVLCDVSSSMNGLPLYVSIALGIVISSLTNDLFKNIVISFSSNPNINIIPEYCKSLYDKVNFLKNIPWEGNTNLYNVFELILNYAKKYNLNPDDMPEKLYIFSDMEFNEACNDYNYNKSIFENIKQLYSNTKYTLPQLFFWNLKSNNNHIPVSFDENNVCLLSGFSPNILKNILNHDNITPYNIMRNIIDDDKYSIIKSI